MLFDKFNKTGCFLVVTQQMGQPFTVGIVNEVVELKRDWYMLIQAWTGHPDTEEDSGFHPHYFKVINERWEDDYILTVMDRDGTRMTFEQFDEEFEPEYVSEWKRWSKWLKLQKHRRVYDAVKDDWMKIAIRDIRNQERDARDAL